MKTFMKVWLGIALMAVGFGIAIVGLAFVTGERNTEAANFTVNESYQDVKNIDMQIAYGEVKIIEGETFSIDAENLFKDSLKSYVKDGTWYIRDDKDLHVNAFGIKFSFGDIGIWDGDRSPNITITVPKGFQAGRYILNVGAGDVKVEAINAAEGDISVDAGRLEVDQLSISEKSEYSVGAGEMVLKNVTINDITLDCGIGNIEVDGIVTGENNISCGVGKIEFDLDGQESDYSYSVSAGIGNVVIGGNSYHNVDQRIDRGNGINDMTFDCGIGNITVDFN